MPTRPVPGSRCAHPAHGCKGYKHWKNLLHHRTARNPGSCWQNRFNQPYRAPFMKPLPWQIVVCGEIGATPKIFGRITNRSIRRVHRKLSDDHAPAIE